MVIEVNEDSYIELRFFKMLFRYYKMIFFSYIVILIDIFVSFRFLSRRLLVI